MLTRRELVLVPAAVAAAGVVASARGKMVLALHQYTSSGAGYRPALEGWAKAGIRHVEITNTMLDGFLKGDTLPAARRVLDDLGLTPVSGACGVAGLWEPGPNHDAAIDSFKRRCEQFSALGLTRIYAPTLTQRAFTRDDYPAIVDAARAVGEAAAGFRMTAMIEAVRSSSYLSTLPTLLSVTRGAAHPNVAPLFDCYHFYSGLSKLEDLDLIRQNEIAHVHFQDVPDIPREMLDNNTRIVPGDGISPLVTILRKLSDKGYAGALSVELFIPGFQRGDPFETAAEIKRKAEAVMRRAGVA